MPKNVFFLLKNCKNCQKLGALPLDHFAFGGWGLRPQTPTLVILHYEIFSLHLQSTDSFGINQKMVFSCNYNRSVLGFWRRKNYTAFRMPQTTEMITIGFNFFVLFPPPNSFCAGATPAYGNFLRVRP